MLRTFDKIYDTLLIRPNERSIVQFFFIVFFLVGFGLSLGRGSADALFFKRYGIEYLPVMFSIAGALLAIVFTLYSAFVDQLSSNKLLTRLLFSSGLIIVASWLVMSINQSEYIYPVYFLVYEVISEVLILHLSLYVAQNFSTQQAKRLIPLILAGTQSGYIIGGIVLATTTQFFEVHNILLLWFGLLVAVAMLVQRFHDKNGTSPHYRPGSRSKQKFKQAITQLKQGLQFTKSSRLLKSMSLAFFFMVVAFYTLCYSTNRLYNETFVSEADLASFFGIMSSANAAIALLLQLFVTNKIIKRYGVEKVNLVFPIMITISFCLLLGAYVLPLAIIATLTKDAIMPAFRNPVRNIFFNALPMQMQGRSRAISIGLILPLALCTTGLMLWLVQKTELPQLVLFSGLLISLCYLFFNVHMNRSYIPAIVSSLRQKIYVPDKGLFDSSSEDTSQAESMLREGINHFDHEIRFAACKTMIKINGKDAIPTVLPKLESFSYAYRDRLIKTMFPYLDISQIDRLWDESRSGDAHYQATVNKIVFQHCGSKYQEEIRNALDSNNPRITGTGIYGVLINNNASMRSIAQTKWFDFLHSSHPGKMLSGIELFAKFETIEHIDRLIELLQHPHDRVKKHAANVLSHSSIVDTKNLSIVIDELVRSEDAGLRIAACHIANNLKGSDRHEGIINLLNDPHPTVRMEASRALFHKEFHASSLLKWIIDNPMPPRAQIGIINVFSQKEPTDEQYLALATWLANRSRDYLGMALSCENWTNNEIQNNIFPILLRERCIETLKLVLQTAMFIEDKDIVTTAMAGLNSQDAHVIDNAIEAIHGLNNKTLAKMLIDTLETYHGTEEHTRTVILSLEEIKSVCNKEKDPWLLTCLTKFLSSTNETVISYA